MKVNDRYREGKSDKGIFFDVPYTYSILQAGYTEGYVKPYSLSSLDHPYSQRVLAMGAHPETRKAALQMLLLYDNCFLDPFDNFTIEGLEQEGLATVAESQTLYLTLRPEDIIQAKALASFIWADLQARGYHYTYEEVIRKISDEAEEHCNLFEERLQRGGGRASAEVQAMLAESKGDFERAHKIRQEYLENAYKIEQEVKEIDQKLNRFQPIVDAYNHISYLLKQSETLKMTALTKVIVPPGQLSKGQLTNALRGISEDEMAVAMLFFDNLKHLEVDSIKDVIKYRKRNEVTEFRTQIGECIEGLRKGKIDLDGIRKRIDKANRAIDKVGIASKAGTWTTALSLPVGILALLSGTPVGFGLTLAGVAALGYSAWLKSHYKWTLLKR